MRIGLIAMSGIRAENEELNKVGLTLPGVVERSRVVAALPSLSLLTLAALTPDDVEIEYHEIQDIRRRPEMPGGFDLVAISTFSAQVLDAYELADKYRANGTAVVMGGLHVTELPDEAQAHCDAIAIGEGELLWPRMIDDFRAGRLRPRYEAPPGVHFKLEDAPLPRFDLLDMDQYNRIPVQTSRGCPHLCDFCASSVLLTPKYSVKPVEKVMAEIAAIKRRWKHPFIEFADDNSFAARGHYKNLLRAIAGEGVKWFTEADISIAEDDELLELLAAGGCRQVLIGLESPTSSGLNGIEIRRNWKLARLPDYETAIQKIQSHGVTVNGCFILGLDGDTPAVFDAVERFVERSGLFEVQITVLTPFPGTPLYRRLKREGRLIEPENWRKCTLFDVNFDPAGMTRDQLQAGLVDLAKRLYTPDAIERRQRRFIETRTSGREAAA